MQQKTNRRRSNESRTKATRAALIAAARTLFVDKGYADTSTPEIANSAGITRGALYHHFKDKADLFRAVVTAEYEAVEAEIEATATREPRDRIDALLLGSSGFLDAMRETGRVRLMLLEAPAVLGRRELDAIDRETSSGALRIGLKAAMDNGELRQLPLEPLTAQLSALYDRAAVGVSEGDDPNEHLAVIEAVLLGLK